MKGRGSWRRVCCCRFRGESLSRPHPPIFFYLICFQHRFSGLSKILLWIQLHICPTTVLMFQWLFSKVVGLQFALIDFTTPFHLNLEGFISCGCSPTTHWWHGLLEFLSCFTIILHWTITLQPLGGVERGRRFHPQTLFDYLVIQVVVLQYHLRH